MFEFLKKILKKEPAETYSVRIDNLDTWFAPYHKRIESEHQARLDTFQQELKANKTQIAQGVETLRNAKLMNPDIPDRAKHFMEGNRDEFIKRVMQFLEEIDFQELEFQSKYQKKLQSLDKSLARPSQILQEFFGREVEAIGNSIRKFSGHVLSLKDLRAPVLRIGRAKTAIAEFKTLLARKNMLEKGLTNVQQELADNDMQQKKLQEELHKLENSKDYQGQQNALRSLQEQMRTKEQLIAEAFSSLDAPLRKYERITFHNKILAQQYINNPIQALVQDSDLQIASMLVSLKEAIEKNKIDVRDRKRAKALSVISDLSQTTLQNWVNDYVRLSTDAREQQEQLSNSPVVAQLANVRQDQERVQASLQRIMQRRTEIEKDLMRIDVKQALEDLQYQLKAATNVDITVVL